MQTKEWIKLESRNEIISKVADMVKTAQHSVYIIGHSARWLEDKSFQEAINTVRNNIDVKFWITCPEDITNRIIGSLLTLKKIGIVDKVFKKSYGRIRICLVDGKKILLAHTLEYQDRRGNTSFGLYFEDNDFGHWLSGRFIELTQDAYEIDEKKFNIMIKSIWFSIKTHWIEWIIVAAIG
ncbi:MAG: hypothetical protein AB1349_06015, partial [Elusimicrobiota bacterium]